MSTSMVIAKMLSTLFGGKKAHDSPPARPTLVDQIRVSMGYLADTATSLNDHWAEERNTLLSLVEEVQALEPRDEISSAKFEQDILGKITSVSTACDRVISGKRSVDLAEEVRGLKTLVKQRRAMQ